MKVKMRCALALGAAALALGLLAAGCGGSGSSLLNGLVGADGQTLPQRDPVPGFTVGVTTDRAVYHTGDPIQITVTATNSTSTAHSLTYPSPSPILKWGYIIASGSTIVAYEYWPGHGLQFAQALTTDTYAPGQSMQFVYTFPYSPSGATPGPATSLPPGTYQVYARQADLTYDGSTAVRHTVPTPASTGVTITVTP